MTVEQQLAVELQGGLHRIGRSRRGIEDHFEIHPSLRRCHCPEHAWEPMAASAITDARAMVTAPLGKKVELVDILI